MKVTSAIGGLAGACALTLINETVKKFDKKAPRLDLLGMNAAAKLVRNDKKLLPIEEKVKPLSLIGDLVSNSLFFGMSSGPTKTQTLVRGALLGLGAGIGAVALPKNLDLDDTPTNFSTKTKVLTVLYYVAGGLVAAAVVNALEGNKRPAPISYDGIEQ